LAVIHAAHPRPSEPHRFALPVAHDTAGHGLVVLAIHVLQTCELVRMKEVDCGILATFIHL
jgi:hypothetical protein